MRKVGRRIILIVYDMRKVCAAGGGRWMRLDA
jgi:hypothetical protein